MSNKLIITSIVLFISKVLFSQSLSINKNALFDGTIKIISQVDKLPGVRDEIISDNVISLVYHTNDSVIPLVKKIDLIFLVNELETYSYRVLCNKVTNKMEADSSIKFANKLLLLPFCNCNFVVKPILSQMNETIDSTTFLKMSEGVLPKNYKIFYTQLLKRANSIITDTSTIKHNNKINYYGLYMAYIKPSLREKYPSCYNN